MVNRKVGQCIKVLIGCIWGILFLGIALAVVFLDIQLANSPLLLATGLILFVTSPFVYCLFVVLSNENQQEEHRSFGRRVGQSRRQLVTTDEVRQFFADLSPRRFEEEVARILKTQGYSVRLTSSTDDFGADIIAEREGWNYVVEVKRYASGTAIGRPALQKLQGAKQHYRTRGMIFVSLSYFSLKAIDYAKREGIRLIDGDELVRMFITASRTGTEGRDREYSSSAKVWRLDID